MAACGAQHKRRRSCRRIMQLPPHHATAIATRSATFCHGHDRATPTPANCLRRRGVVLIFVCGGARLHAAPLRGRRRYRDAKMRAPAAASGVPTRRHAPFTISSQARRLLGKELKPASRRASNACQRIESTRNVNESTFSEAWNPTYPCYKVPCAQERSLPRQPEKPCTHSSTRSRLTTILGASESAQRGGSDERSSARIRRTTRA